MARRPHIRSLPTLAMLATLAPLLAAGSGALVACGGDGDPGHAADPAPASSDASTSSDASASGSRPDGGSDASVPAALPTGTFRIGMWCGPPPAELTKARFDEIAAAGFTTVARACEGASDQPAYATLMLSLAKQAGLDAFVADSRIAAALAGTDVDKNLDAVVAAYAQEPALAAYDVTDEPGSAAFPAIAAVVKGLATRDPKHFAYINLFPTYAPLSALGTPSYDAYVDQYLSVVRPAGFSFDYYPFLVGSDDPGFFANLAIIRAQSLAHKTPFWQFVQSVDFNNHRTTTKAEKLWIGTQTLAYGGVGVSYFTYWTPPVTPENFGSGIIDHNGTRSPQYAEVTENNARLKAFGRYLVAATHTAVFHNGPLAAGTVPREPAMPAYLPNDAPITVGLFSTGDDAYVFLANRDHTAKVETDVYLAATAALPEMLDVAAGTFQPVTVLETNAKGAKVHVAIAPGDGALFHLRGPVPKGAPGAEAFIGSVRGNQGALDVVDSSFGTSRLRDAGFDDCPAGYSMIGHDFDPNGFWLCARKDLATRTFLVGNVVSDAGTLFSVHDGAATAIGAAGWTDCRDATFVGRRFESNGYWVCMK